MKRKKKYEMKNQWKISGVCDFPFRFQLSGTINVHENYLYLFTIYVPMWVCVFDWVRNDDQ